MKQTIPSDEISFHPLSFQDEAGRLFKWRGGLYRAITAQSAAFFTRFVQSDASKRLIAAGLLAATENTSFAIDGFDLVLRHRLLPHVSYPFEWCPPMFKAASLAIVDVAIELSRHDLMLKDAHPWNVLFDGCQPVWIDLTSIVPADGSQEWPATDEFYNECLNPLILMAQGRERLAKWLVAENGDLPFPELQMLRRSHSVMSDIAALLRRRIPEPGRKLLRKILPLHSLSGERNDRSRQLPLLQRLQAIRSEVENVALPEVKAGISVEPQSSWNARQLSLYKILRENKPKTVLDIASGAGWFSELAAQFSEHVVAFDSDPHSVAQLFTSARARQLPILPLVMDFGNPTPALGLASHSRLAASERFPCEMVLMLGFLHEMIFKYRRLGLEEICDGLALFSKRWVVVEFIPREDAEVTALWSDWFAGYTLDNLKHALRKHFSRIEVLPSHPEPRVLLFCERGPR